MEPTRAPSERINFLYTLRDAEVETAPVPQVEKNESDEAEGLSDDAMLRDFDAIMARLEIGIADQRIAMAALLERLQRPSPQ